jgi:hypothetical protein
MSPNKSYLDLVKATNNFPQTGLEEKDMYLLFLHGDDRPHGLMRESIVRRMPWGSYASIDHDKQSVTVLPSGKSSESTQDNTNAVGDQFTASFSAIVSKAVEENIFELLRSAHSEPNRVLGANHFVQVERFSHSLFGIAARGAHLTAYVNSSDGLRVWVPRRARHLFTYPGTIYRLHSDLPANSSREARQYRCWWY